MGAEPRRVLVAGYVVAEDAACTSAWSPGAPLVAAVLWLLRRDAGPAAVPARLLPLVVAAVVDRSYALARTDLAYPATWSDRAAAGSSSPAVVLDAVVHRHVPWRPLLIVALAWMVSLSWGYVLPGPRRRDPRADHAGAARRAVPETTSEGRHPLGRGSSSPGPLRLVAFTVLLVAEHDRAPAIDRPQAELTARPRQREPRAARHLRTHPATARYPARSRECRPLPRGSVAVYRTTRSRIRHSTSTARSPRTGRCRWNSWLTGPQRMLGAVAGSEPEQEHRAVPDPHLGPAAGRRARPGQRPGWTPRT